MSAKRIAMRKIREILRLRLEAGLSVRQINASAKVSVGAIQKLLKKAEELSLNWPLPDELDDSRLAALFYPQADPLWQDSCHHLKFNQLGALRVDSVSL